MRNALQSLWDEPRVPDPPPRDWRDWALVGILAPVALIEAILTAEVAWLPVALVLAILGVGVELGVGIGVELGLLGVDARDEQQGRGEHHEAWAQGGGSDVQHCRRRLENARFDHGAARNRDLGTRGRSATGRIIPPPTPRRSAASTGRSTP